MLICGLLLPGVLHAQTPVESVDPLIDTVESRWFYFNSASRPFGMVNLSPDTSTRGSWKSGYLYKDKEIRCFSHIHAWQLSGVVVMPTTSEMTGHMSSWTRAPTSRTARRRRPR
jgi:putative alpha-1,2-mannosidase